MPHRVTQLLYQALLHNPSIINSKYSHISLPLLRYLSILQSSEFSLFSTIFAYIFQQVFPCGRKSENVAEKRNRLQMQGRLLLLFCCCCYCCGVQMSKSKSRNKVDLELGLKERREGGGGGWGEKCSCCCCCCRSR